MFHRGVQCDLCFCEDRKLQMSETKELRKILFPTKDKASGECKIVHNMELFDSWKSSILRLLESKRLFLAGHVVWMGKAKSIHRILVGNPLRK